MYRIHDKDLEDWEGGLGKDDRYGVGVLPDGKMRVRQSEPDG
jgi:hypothetical protein